MPSAPPAPTTSAPEGGPSPACHPLQELVLLARQPILDATSAVGGYELLFRRPDGSNGPIEDAARATAHVMVSAFTNIGIDDLAGDVPVWINVSREFLLLVDPLPLPADRVVLELLEDMTPDDELLARLDVLREQGYRFALDDFTWSDAYVPLVQRAAFVKLDVLALGAEGVRRQVELLSTSGVRLVAEKVETLEERDACAALGIDLFQGYFFERPVLVTGRTAPASMLQRLQDAAKLQGDPTFEEVEETVLLDPGLSIRMLRFVNSAGTGLRSRVSSLRQALVLVGARTVRQWALLVLLTDLGQGRPAVLSQGLVRARLCQSLARDAGADEDAMFAVGLLSIVDALLDMPLDEVIGTLPLTSEVQDAIVDRAGPLGALLHEACRLQRGDGGATTRAAGHVRDAFDWTDTTLRDLGPA